MSLVLVIGLLAAEPVLEIEHRARIDHAGTSVETRYRTRVTLSHRQRGTPGKPGGASTLRCDWRADIVLERHARHGSGSTLTRALARNGAVTGSRPGWCGNQRAGIAREIAARESELRDHAVRMAREDETQLRAELGRTG